MPIHPTPLGSSGRGLAVAPLLTLLVSAPLFGCTEQTVERSRQDEFGVRQVSDRVVPRPDSVTARLYDEVMTYARSENLHELPIGEIMQALGLRFTSMPYMAGLLDAPAEETLVCRLDGFDCVTFVESALALARGVRAEDYSYETFSRNMLDQRYRGGAMEGYCSRLHYFSEWIADNEERGTVRNITLDLGGTPLDKHLTFMSEHRESYPRFVENDSLYQCIREMEAMLADMKLYYVPQDHIDIVYQSLQAGDIIAIATSIEGLDVSHTGLVYKDAGGKTGLLHASTTGGVKVSPDLQAYVQNNRSQIGIVVARPL